MDSDFDDDPYFLLHGIEGSAALRFLLKSKQDDIRYPARRICTYCGHENVFDSTSDNHDFSFVGPGGQYSWNFSLEQFTAYLRNRDAARAGATIKKADQTSLEEILVEHWHCEADDCQGPHARFFLVAFYIDDKNHFKDCEVFQLGDCGYLVRATGMRHDFGPIPNHIAKAISEAEQILEISTAASAVMSRKALQGLIRHLFNLPKSKQGNLATEIKAAAEQMDGELLEVIHSARMLGNIGAHFEKDTDRLLEVKTSEAEALINLNAYIVDEYVHREERRKAAIRKIKSETERS